VQHKTAPRELSHQVPPLVRHLAGRDANLADRAHAADLAAIKGITTQRCLGMNGSEIGIYGGAGCGVGAETLKLRMVAITHGASAQDGLRQQRLAPQRNEALRIKISGMD
jgi:hypothetical protein